MGFVPLDELQVCLVQHARLWNDSGRSEGRRAQGKGQGVAAFLQQAGGDGGFEVAAGIVAGVIEDREGGGKGALPGCYFQRFGSWPQAPGGRIARFFLSKKFIRRIVPAGFRAESGVLAP